MESNKINTPRIDYDIEHRAAGNAGQSIAPTLERENEAADLLVRIYEMHEAIITETGGLPVLRDGAMLHAAVTRPFATFGGQELYPTDF